MCHSAEVVLEQVLIAEDLPSEANRHLLHCFWLFAGYAFSQWKPKHIVSGLAETSARCAALFMGGSMANKKATKTATRAATSSTDKATMVVTLYDGMHEPIEEQDFLVRTVDGFKTNSSTTASQAQPGSNRKARSSPWPDH